MTYQEFVNKYNGQYVDTDGYPKDWKWQCYDLAQLYFQEVLDVPYDVLQGCDVVKNMILWDWKYNMLLEYFDEIDTTAMQQGDISIWTDGPGGHIAIFDHYNPENNQCYYFSQNPNPCQIMIINMEGHHAFRRKQPTPPPPTPEVTPNVERDEYKDQIRVKEGITELRVRVYPSLNDKVIGVAKVGYYNFYEVFNNDGYDWYKIAQDQWVAYNEEWFEVLPAQQPTEPPTTPPTTPPEEYVKLKVLDRKDDNVLVELKTWIKE